jgi:chromatin assembly factor 1 subunit A
MYTSEYLPSLIVGTSKTSSFPAGPQTKQSDVEIKNGKVIFKQKPMSFEKMTETMQGV